MSFDVGVNAVFIIIITTIILFVLSIFYFFIDNRTITRTKNERSKNLGISVLVFIVLAALLFVFKKYQNI